MAGLSKEVTQPPGTSTTIEAWELFKFLILLNSSGANGGR
jgi:hypothetical protein